MHLLTTAVHLTQKRNQRRGVQPPIHHLAVNPTILTEQQLRVCVCNFFLKNCSKDFIKILFLVVFRCEKFIGQGFIPGKIHVLSYDNLIPIFQKYITPGSLNLQRQYLWP